MATIEKRGESYRITVSDGYDVSGTQLRQRMTWTPKPGMTKKQIQKELDRQAVLFEEKVKTGKYIDSSIKFADFAEDWIKKYAEKNLAPTTVASYQTYLKRINKAIGNIHLSKLRPQHLIDFYNNLSEDGIRENTKWCTTINLSEYLKKREISQKALAQAAHITENTVGFACKGKNITKKSSKAICKALGLKLEKTFAKQNDRPLSGNTILHYHHMISSILSTAVTWQVIPDNPAERVKPPKAEDKEAAYLDMEQVRHLIELLDAEPIQYRVAIVLLIYSGFRREELCGLEWKDINFDKNIISIRRASQCLPKKGVFTAPTKTKKSNRTLQLALSVYKMLRAYKVWQSSEKVRIGDKWCESDRLFTTWNGKPIRPDALTHWFHNFIQNSDLPNEIHLHSLRHTNATLLIADGINVRLVADMLGHSKPTTTLNIYSHAIQSAQAAASARIADILNPHEE